MARIDTNVKSYSPATSPRSPRLARSPQVEAPRLFFSLALLQPATVTIETLPDAIQQFEDHLIDNTSVFMITTHLLNIQYALGYVLSAISEPSFNFIGGWLSEQFPTTVTEYLAPCLFARCLENLVSLVTSPDITTSLPAECVPSNMKTAFLVPQVLQALVNIQTSEADLGIASSSTPRPQVKQRRKSKASNCPTSDIDERLFSALGISIPESRAEASALLESIFLEQRMVFKALLEIVRRPEIQAVLRNNYLVFGPNSDAPGNGALTVTSTASEQNSRSGDDLNEFGDLRAYLTYASPAHFGPWRILLTGRASKDLEGIRKGGSKLYDIVLQKLCDLSHGKFSLTNQKRISNGSPVDIFEARLPGNPRLVYQVDCIREARNESPKQVLLVYGIYDHKGVSRTPWDKYGKQQARRGAEYVDACRYRNTPRMAGNDVFEPGEFPSMTVSLDMVQSYVEDDEDGQASLSKAEIRELHTLLVLGRHAFLSQNFLDGLLQEEGVAQIHQLSQRECEVVEHTDSCFVLGRSGTGKTTTILFKMFGIERAWEHLAHAQSSRPRQIFVTKSSLLAKKVEQDFISFIRYDAMSENAPAHFIQRANRVESLESDALFTTEHLGVWRSDIPSRYSELTDEHFPLFVTYHELCTMIENDDSIPLSPTMGVYMRTCH